MNELYTCQCRDGKTVSGFSRWSLTELKLMNPLELAAVLQELRDYARYYEATFFYPALSLQNEEAALIRRFQRTKHHTACCGAVTGVLGAVWLLLVLIPAFRFSQLTMLMALLTLVSIIVLIPFLFLLVSAQEDYGKRLPRIHAKQGKLAQQEEREIYGDYLDYLIGGYLISPEYSLCSEALEMMRKALCAKQGTEAGIDAYLDRVLEVMGNAATEPLGNPQPSVGGLIGGEAAKLRAALEDADPRHRLVDPLAARAAQYALATLETNGRMGVIVATPTAGSAGVLPGVLLALRDERGFSHDQLREGILTAAGLGYLIARNASVSGAEGGCQAEVGSAAAMAAAAAVALAGGAPDRCLAAGANVMMSLLGLVCDPVGGLVEVPCQKRNATAASVAFVSAQIALSGVQNLISFDEAVAVMDEVGRGLPPELRETALGGIAKAPSACAFCAGC